MRGTRQDRYSTPLPTCTANQRCCIRVCKVGNAITDENDLRTKADKAYAPPVLHMRSMVLWATMITSNQVARLFFCLLVIIKNNRKFWALFS